MLSSKIKQAANDILERIDGKPAHIEIRDSFPEHIGLGSGTQASIAGALAVLLLNDKSLPLREVAKIVGRGGTSGIGTAAFDCGGFILDGGHDFDEKGAFLPSSESSVSPPPVISRFDFPDWEIMVVIPEGRGAHGSNETSIFGEECPIPAGEVETLCRIILMKLLPSIAMEDFEEFRESIRLLQQTGFKRRELDRQPESKDIIMEMYNQGYAAGMSSFGPAVYVIHPEPIDLNNIAYESYKTNPNNSGAKIRINTP